MYYTSWKQQSLELQILTAFSTIIYHIYTILSVPFLRAH